MLHIKYQQANICAGALQSYPPQCAGGVPVAGLETFAGPPNLLASSRGVTWGDVLLIGTYEDGILTLTQRPLPRPAPRSRFETIDAYSASGPAPMRSKC
jgi:hypothetical protein